MTGPSALLAFALGLTLGRDVAALKVGPLDGARELLEDHHSSMDFDEFTRAHARDYREGTQEYSQRKDLFQQRAAEVARHNSQPDRMWTATINHLTDRTSDEELKQLRGYRRDAPREEPAARRAALLGVQARAHSRRLQDLPASFIWQNLHATNSISDQKACGSCWAIAASEVIRAHAEIHVGGADRVCSVEQIVACTPNPAHCGGSGGCSGATTELAMEYVMGNGCVQPSQWPYSAQTEACPTNMSSKQPLSFWSGVQSTAELGRQGTDGSAEFGMVGYRKLPENMLSPLMLAVYEQGPVAVSVAAGAGWNMYHSGIMNACGRDAVISHALALIGFGEADGKRGRKYLYWLLQNSWGKRWGESGTIRLQRHSNEEEQKYCGWDRKPDLGSGCS
eukprot:CAMPEP_0168498718 /NCGR_PEP_ID=MMETSP0228-20121227/73419_1 /TAXON_ID=133427 /ORGANISM="Protoceratium reticulatum, Strain CCCM 535 (=CCMP 1889)" /LENGTH=393 /DNA_ID=CAMNT_0008515621 /DNA_START=37 /DNA_END=1215 /DNA_ORIENTATION=-